ncbi:sodium/glucose cotransporter 5-like [Lingula anatina]|uniref:Sodium/glucose cotransporter 5-like n=1 Tax=Lingula anatina TaxID=7574 RepID=A0A1S3K986_LINAN|nr:sodium/glucose cotransporter 5-like [Lingula anatina]|eukprot:XP_013419014.1 sodium/glucose cotransporter 5-like [Lingula anatina]
MEGKYRLEAADYAVIAGHFLLTVGVGIWSTVKSNRGTARGYFLAGRDMSWWLVGLSLYVSNIGSSSFIGLAGAASANGIAVVCYELSGLFCILLLGFFFVPVYISAGVYTMPEYLLKRFGSQRLEVYLAVQNLLLFAFTKLSAEIFAGTVIVKEVLGWDQMLSVLLLMVATALYTVLGGLAAVIYTDALQTFVLLIGAVILAVIAMVRVGGYGAMEAGYMLSVPNATKYLNTSCGLPEPDAFHILREATDPNYPWTGVVFGATVLSSWYFCTDQVLVQRTLSARNTLHAKAGSILAAYLKVLPLFLMVWPGMISRVLFTDDVACSTPEECNRVCGNANGCANIAYPKLVLELMPTGLRGLMLAAMLAALMSSLTSIFNSGSTVFTINVWKKIRKNASEWELMIVGRVFVLVFIGFSVVWLPIVGGAKDGQLFNYLQSIASYLAPPILACFGLGVAWKRINEPGAFWGMMVGLVLGLARMIADFALPAPPCGLPDSRPWILKDFHYLNYAFALFIVCIIVTITVSMFTKPQPEEELARLTWGTRYDCHPSEITTGRDNEGLDVSTTTVATATSGGIETIELSQKSLEEIRSYEEDIIHKSMDSWSIASADVQKPTPTWKKVIYWICGHTPQNENEHVEDHEKADRKLAAMAMEENPKWRRIINVNLIVCLGVGAFLWGFFG